MDKSLNYADLIKKKLQEATIDQPRLQPIRIYPVCDRSVEVMALLDTGASVNVLSYSKASSKIGR